MTTRWRPLQAAAALIFSSGCSFLVPFEPPPSPSCEEGLTSCGEACSNLATPDHCGSCEQGCSPLEFCPGTACASLSLGSLCAVGSVVGLYVDGHTNDNVATDGIGEALTARCPGAPPYSTVSITDAGPTLDPTTLLPLTLGSQLVVMSGGAGSTPPNRALRDARVPTTYMVTPSDGGTCLYALETEFGCQTSNGEYLFATELVRSGDAGSVSLMSYGAWATGTRAASMFIQSKVLADPSQYPHRWYVMKWVSPDGGSTPGPDDSFLELGSGD